MLQTRTSTWCLEEEDRNTDSGLEVLMFTMRELEFAVASHCRLTKLLLQALSCAPKRDLPQIYSDTLSLVNDIDGWHFGLYE